MNKTIILRILSAAVAAAMPQLIIALPAYGWLWTAIGAIAGGTAFKGAK